MTPLHPLDDATTLTPAGDRRATGRTRPRNPVAASGTDQEARDAPAEA